MNDFKLCLKILIHCSNLTLINITNFNFLINTDICNVTNIALVTLVHTAMEHKDARNVIRLIMQSVRCK